MRLLVSTGRTNADRTEDDMGIEVVSIHVPKAGGTSLVRSIIAAYGPTAVRLDYEDDPSDPCCSFNLDPDGCCERTRLVPFDPTVRVVHGHLPAAKYAHLPDALRITFLRDPITNLISIHRFWQTYD